VGEVAGVGVHRELVHAEPRYRAVVTRETDEEAALNAALHDSDAVAEGDGAALGRGLKELQEKELQEIEESA
jgi:putative ABC transport system ATP-binding protein